MIDFRVYDESDAPEAARPMLEAAKKRMGFVTTLNAVMAESPELLAGYNALAEQFGRSSLSLAAKQVVLITASVENGCEYCVAAHSTLALRAHIPAEVVQALREGKQLPDAELEAVRRLTQAMVAQRGSVDDAEIEAFLAAGHTRRHVLDIVLGVGMKTLSNYTNHITHIPLDPAWQDQQWTHEQAM
ncbi:carboxymuconolactone decarboxylase family protein [Planotetraspora sp. A-T 1434]|nr:carboxymuconolactone decarboxylase family protein [Planotetraspora sp. A-T 1434]MCT9933324.1 carboxymuconolactone decarboxylase family protein [Planotetraspora sp. A-T 1434]